MEYRYYAVGIHYKLSYSNHFSVLTGGRSEKKLQHSVDEYHNGKLGVKEVLFL